MGLVALSPADMLASVVAAAQAPAGAGSPTPAPADGFAALVAAVLGDGNAPAAAPDAAFPLPKQPDREGRGRTGRDPRLGPGGAAGSGRPARGAPTGATGSSELTGRARREAGRAQ